MVIVDDYSRYTWVSFVAHKNETFSTFLTLLIRLTNEKNTTINLIRIDHCCEFDNIKFEEFCNKNGIEQNFSTPRTPQQNGTVEKKNRTLEQMARTMLCENNLSRYFWLKLSILHIMFLIDL